MQPVDSFRPGAYSQLHGQQNMADVCLTIREEESGEAAVTLPAHRFVLWGQSEYCKGKARVYASANAATLCITSLPTGQHFCTVSNSKRGLLSSSRIGRVHMCCSSAWQAGMRAGRQAGS
jgi:hypothetical protein